MRLVCFAAWTVLLGSACEKSSLVSATSDYGVGQQAVVFARTWVGFPSEHPLEILSRSRVHQSLPVEVSPPFFVDQQLVELGGGDTAVLVVRFAPGTAGVFHEVLKVGELEVRLDGEGLAPPPCEVSLACRTAAFDPSTGTCVTQVLADGTACATDACIDEGRCFEGECVGTAKSCDDDNACTRDWCARGLGCQHADSSSECPAPTDVCQAASCDARTGCGVSPVADGTPCGDVSCVTANVCMQGRCVAVTPPDGFECAPTSPCQDRGVCRAQECIQPDPYELTPRWTWDPPGDRFFVFDGVSDPQGNFWWVECMAGETMSCHAVSVTKDGLVRFTGGAVSGMNSSETAQLFDEGRFVFATANGVLVAVDGLTGRELWRTQLLPLLGYFGGAQTIGLTSDGRGHLWASVADDGRCLVDTWAPGVLAQLDAATGALRFTTPFEASGPAVADEQGNLYVTRLDPQRLASWSPQATVRLDVAADGGVGLVAAGQGRVVMASNRSFATGNGVELLPWSERDLLWDAALQVGGQTIRLQREPYGPLPPIMPGTNVVLFDAANPSGRPLAHVAGPSGEVTLPVLAQRDTVLVAGRQLSSKVILKGVTTAGVSRFSCELSEPALGGMTTAIEPKVGFSGDRLAVVYQPICPSCLFGPRPILQVFDTTGLGVATSGWVAPRGTPGNAGRAR